MKKIIKTNLVEVNVNFVESTTKQSTYFKIFLALIVISIYLFSFFVFLTT